MAGASGKTTRALAFEDQLKEEPFHFDFFQALRWLECEHVDKPRLGESLRASDDPVRLAQEPSLQFAPATLASFEPGGAKPSRISVNFLGLLGPHGPLPQHLTEYALERIRHHGDPTFSRFLDVFHHRALALFYRAWANAQPTVSRDRPQSDRFTLYVGSLLGLGMPALRDRDPAPDSAKLHYAGHFATQSHHPEGLGSTLHGYFDIPIEIREFIGEWVTLPDHCRWRLGYFQGNSTLGETTVLGAQAWECQHKFRIAAGPISLEDYHRLLPGEDPLARFIALVRQYVGDEFDWDLNLILDRHQVPALKLGERGRLGWTTWLKDSEFDHDADDLRLDPMYWLKVITDDKSDAQRVVNTVAPAPVIAQAKA
ncbi:MAG: type VI secretion system baseplate subunit TssG [Gammaproteobacteria bacterium]|nr:type VI secretion system baseplate subunit TssG [Gammaproteobacteria bacterium]MDH3465096.1 type VI secretion system baseplate subunit TssG [Gammaproteobacteria bacterium]